MTFQPMVDKNKSILHQSRAKINNNSKISFAKYSDNGTAVNCMPVLDITIPYRKYNVPYLFKCLTRAPVRFNLAKIKIKF